MSNPAIARLKRSCDYKSRKYIYDGLVLSHGKDHPAVQRLWKDLQTYACYPNEDVFDKNLAAFVTCVRDMSGEEIGDATQARVDDLVANSLNGCMGIAPPPPKAQAFTYSFPVCLG